MDYISAAIMCFSPLTCMDLQSSICIYIYIYIYIKKTTVCVLLFSICNKPYKLFFLKFRTLYKCACATLLNNKYPKCPNTFGTSIPKWSGKKLNQAFICGYMMHIHRLLAVDVILMLHSESVKY